MKGNLTFAQGARILFVVSVLALLFFLLYPAQRLILWTKRGDPGVIPVMFHRVIIRLLGIKISIEGQPSPQRPLLLASNHVSWLDISLMGALFPLSFIAKSEVDGWPVIGVFARLQRTIFIERQRRQATGAVTGEIGERLAAGDCLVLFAEGTSSEGSHVLPFRSSLLGGVRKALLADGKASSITVQPVAIAYQGYRGLPMNRARRPSYAWYGDMDLTPHLLGVIADGAIDVTIAFGEPLPLTLADDRKAAAQTLEQASRRLLHQALQGRAAADRAVTHILNAADSR